MATYSPQSHHPNLACLARRRFLAGAGLGLGLTALGSLLAEENLDAPISGLPAAAAKAKRVIFLFQSGAPSQLELFDPKPELKKRHGDDLPDSVRRGQRLTTMTSGQTKFPIVATPYQFKQHGSGGTWISELLPHTALSLIHI